MLDFEETHSKALINSPWLCKIHDSTAYLFKCHIREDNQSCCFIITDTERVWTEVLESRHITRRTIQCFSSASNAEYDEDAEPQLLKRNIVILHNLHRPEAIADADFTVGSSSKADLEVNITLEDFAWRWDAISLSGRQSAKLLSVHLITPLMSFAAMSTFIDEPLREISVSSLTRSADSQAKTAKRSIARQTLGCISKPMVASTLQRISQIIDEQPTAAPILISEEDYAPALPVPPLPPSTSFKGKRRRSLSPSPARQSSVAEASKPLFLDSQTYSTGTQPASLPRSRAVDPETEDEDEPVGGPSAQPLENDSSQSPARPSKASSPTSSQFSPPPAKVARPTVDSDEDSDAAEAKRRAAITKITQSKTGPAMKAPTKKRRF